MSRFDVFVMLALILLPARLSAQIDERAPGIYAIVGQESIPLHYSRCTLSSSSGSLVRHVRYKYKDECSGVNASDTFVLVIDRENIVYSATDPFMRVITPSHMIFIPVEVNHDKKRREYEPGTLVEGDFSTLVEARTGYDFEWEQITDNSYMIKVFGLTPGEYAVSFCVTKSGEFDFHYGIYGFTIPGQVLSDVDLN